jgi:AraC-like DNA-binding protein
MTAGAGCKIPVGLVAAMQESGVSPAHVLATARLPSRLLDVPGRYVPPSEYFALWRAIREVSGNPNIGLVLATAVKPDLTEPLFLAILSAVDLAHAIGVVSRFKRLLEPEDLIVVEDQPSKRLVATYDWPDSEASVPQALIDAELAFLVAIGRRGTGDPDLSPCEISMCAQELEPGARHADFFRCTMTFGASRNAVAFPIAEVQRPFVTHNPQLLTALWPYLQANTPPPPTSTVARVRAVIAERVRGQRPDADSVARDLAMSTRAMQRMLRDHGTSFRRLLDEVRNEQARGYLASTAFSDAEVSFLLGFEDPNSFYRAFRSWNGMSPSAYRRQEPSILTSRQM